LMTRTTGCEVVLKCNWRVRTRPVLDSDGTLMTYLDLRQITKNKGQDEGSTSKIWWKPRGTKACH